MNDTSHAHDNLHHDAHHDLVSVTEIADFLRQLRTLSPPPLPAGAPSTDQADQRAAERAAFLTRKADLLARITAQHPYLAPPPPSPADDGPTDDGPTDDGPA
jgi:hypothetical protein